TSACTRSGVSGEPSSALSASRYSLPAARQRENVIGHLVGRTVGPHANEAGDAAHPLSLVGGELPGARDERRLGLLGRELADLADADDFPCGRGQLSAKGPPDLLLDPGLEHRARPAHDPLLELLRWDVEPDDRRRLPRVGGPE